ncbi:hypothetical protein AMJ87_00010 [candidate division WOR_3 bacterium SM23_60]|uniref:Enoyl-CoA hydratase n=1 Tax=candidate division WOR_3 bacterium SM23_60 TaxID=1703780 RepID=A0A0S8GLN6_UNCW3|nr:MAG: hypothetical protein AMJ87_00010 [candidate division WOR_3 bacterium SM23_60]
MKFIERELRKKVAILKLNRSVTNPINLELINQLSGQIKMAKDDKDIAGIVFTSANSKFFSIGFDIPELINSTRAEFKEFYHYFNQLCIDLFTLCCDYRFIGEGKKLMGLNEIKLGVPVPYPADCILRQIVDDRAARIILDTGDFFPPEETLKMGLVDEVMPQEHLVNKAVERVESIQSLSLDAYCIIKRNRTEAVESQIRTSLAEKEKIFIEMWYSAETRKKLKAALEKF